MLWPRRPTRVPGHRLRPTVTLIVTKGKRPGVKGNRIHTSRKRDVLKRTKHYRSSLPFPLQKERDHCRGYTNILTRILRKFYENLCHICGSFLPVLHQLLIDEFASKKWLGTAGRAKPTPFQSKWPRQAHCHLLLLCCRIPTLQMASCLCSCSVSDNALISPFPL